MKSDILIVDRDRIFAEGLKYTLEQDGSIIEIIGSGKETIEKLRTKSYDLIILELNIPDINGFELCKDIRSISLVPIIIATEDNKDMSKILALEYGADDYMVKPFNILELKARIKSIFRRINCRIADRNKHILKLKDFTINTLKRRITMGDREIDLTGKEFDLFYALSSNPGKIFTREELLEKVWGYSYFGDLRTIDVHIRRIREKLSRHSKSTQYIMTKWGVGYYFNKI